jgi:hypothetical protein
MAHSDGLLGLAQSTEILKISILRRKVATFRRKIAASAPEFGIRAFAENCKVVRI